MEEGKREVEEYGAVEKAYSKLVKPIVDLSQANEWFIAKEEWELETISYDYSDSGKCICGKVPIRHMNNMKNKKNGNEAIVGRCCVKKFDMHGSSFYDILLRVYADKRKSVGRELLEYCFEKGILSEKEYSFYKDTVGKRVLSPAQVAWRIDINRKIVSQYIR